MRKLKIGVLGASGRMGGSTCRLLQSDYAHRLDLVAKVSEKNGTVSDFSDVDVVIDFSLPAGTEALVNWALSQEGQLPVLVCGTTGQTESQQQLLNQLGEKTQVLHSSNFSLGVAALREILEFAAPTLTSAGYKSVLTDIHHAKKQDAPSGTALTLLSAMDVGDTSQTEIHSVRAGGVIGKHDVVFYGPSDQITIGHEAQSRDLFASGAIDAALWLCDQPESATYYTMSSYFRKRFSLNNRRSD